MNRFSLTPVATVILAMGTAQVYAQQAAPSLPPVVVSAEPESYTPPSSRAGSRTETLVEQIPQSIVVIPRVLIEDQGSQSLDDVLRNVSNVNQVDSRDANNVTFKIRGFNSATAIDRRAHAGLFHRPGESGEYRAHRCGQRPRRWLVRQSAGTGLVCQFGRHGGHHHAEPQDTAFKKLGGALGSHGARSLNFDVNQPLGGGVAVRLNGEVSKSDSETDRVFFDRTALFPSLSWTPDAERKLVLRGRYLKNSTLDYSGLPVVGTLDTRNYKLARNTMIAAVDQPDTTNQAQGFNLQWSQKLNAQWTFNLTAARNQATVDQRGAWLSGSSYCTFGDATVDANILCGARLWDRFKSTTVSPALTGVFQVGAAKHTLNTGLDVERTRDDAFMTYSNLFGPISMDIISLRTLNLPTWAEPGASNPPDQQNRYKAKVLYLQDQVDIGAWHVLGSLRHNQLDVTDSNPAWMINNHSRITRNTPRAGVVYDLSPGLSAFVGYAESVKVPTGSIFVEQPKPEEAQQQELGLKLKNLSGVSGTLAYFKLDRKNAAVSNPAVPGTSIQTGLQRSQGVDIDLRWQASRQLTWIAALTSQTAQIVQDTRAALVGKQLFNVPEHTLRLAAHYEFSGAWSGLGLGAGLTHHTQLPGDSTNTFFTPSATVWDAQLAYKSGAARYGVSIKNLFDHRYYVPSAYFGGGQVTPATPRTLMATAQWTY